MCGLVGAIGRLGPTEKKMFRDMLVLDQVRGFDSTGVVLVPYVANDSPVILKDVGAAQNLWEYDTGQLFDYRGVVKVPVRALIGHNRAATTGQITIDNAHPFQFGNVYGAHNGSLTYWSNLEGADEFDVDSKAIFKNIEVKGIDSTWDNLYGAAALTWWDNDSGHLNMIRNSERPLWLCYNKAKTALFWASEPWMITVSASRSRVDLDQDEEKLPNLFKLEEHLLMRIKADPLGNKEVLSVEERKLPKKTRTVYRGYHGYGAGFANNAYAPQFFKSKGWKKISQRLTNPVGDALITNLRYVRKITALGQPETVFRASVAGKSGVMVADLDVYPTNKTEFDRLISLSEKIKANPSFFKLSLKNNPRVDSRFKGGTIRYLCAYSSLGVEEIIPPKKDNVEELLTHKGRDGEDISLKEAEKIIKECGGTCCYCSQTVEPRDIPRGLFINKTEFLCPECNENWGDNIQQLIGSV